MRLLEQARRGNSESLRKLFDRHRKRLRRMVEMRLDTRLEGRVDPSEVVQKALLMARARLDGYLKAPKLPLFLWLRLVVAKQLTKVHRRFLGAPENAQSQKVSLYRGALPAADPAALAVQLLGMEVAPAPAALYAERMLLLQEALNSLDPIDREVLSLRHFEELTRAETARALGIEPVTAARRYLRALKRLKRQLPDK